MRGEQATAIIEFLRDRLNEEEGRALALDGESWEAVEDDEGVCRVWKEDTIVTVADTMRAEESYHIAYWDPARVLAEVAAKQRLIGDLLDGDHAPWTERYLKILARPYAGHPDYREEWAAMRR